MTGPPVAIVIEGSLVAGSIPARLCRDVVMAPLAPYFRDLAERIVVDPEDGHIVVARGNRSVWVSIGSPVLHTATGSQTLPRAPFLHHGEPLLPLGAIARALGASVEFDAGAKMLSIAATPDPLARMTADPSYVPPADPLGTFTPQPTPAPAVQVTGSPRPRRTPIPASTAGGGA